MQIEIKLAPHEESLLSFDYLYALHSAIMKTIDAFRPEMAESLHEGAHKNKLKLFTFSPLNSFPLPKLVQIDGEPKKATSHCIPWRTKNSLTGRFWEKETGMSRILFNTMFVSVLGVKI